MSQSLSVHDLNWLNLNLDELVEAPDIARQKITAAAILERLYGPNAVPGAILADEVGMGKTYVSLAVAASVFKRKGPETKVLVLTSNNNMTQIWRKRWDLLRSKQVENSFLPKGKEVDRLDRIKSGISFVSYESMKNTTGNEVRDMFEKLAHAKNAPRGKNRSRLLKELFRAQRLVDVPVGTGVENPRTVSRKQMNRFWFDNYDRNSGKWVSVYGAYRNLQRLVLSTRRPAGTAADLLILDEAHRLGGEQNHAFLQEVLSSKAHRALLVTATPFSLDIDELIERIKDLYTATIINEGTEVARLKETLNEFRSAVRTRDPPSTDLKTQVETKLRRYLVRNTWPDKWPNGKERRRLNILDVPQDLMASPSHAFATFALESKFMEMLSGGARPHIASNRETLCSSYSAIRHSNEKSGQFNDVVAFLPPKAAGNESPKLEFAVSEIERIVRSNPTSFQKIVVFCERNATIRELRKRLKDRFQREQKDGAKKWVKVRAALHRREFSGNIDRARFASYYFKDLDASRIDEVLNQLNKELIGREPQIKYWSETWGPSQHIDYVATITGDQSEEDKPIEHTQFAFNLPGPPYVLICSQKGRESIDLHLSCRRIMHYDLEWSPSAMEQRVGRVDRINSLAFREKEPVEIYLFDLKGTYEERILKVIRERTEMTRVLLGAGEWLKDDGELREMFAGNLADYKLNFSPSVKPSS
ncbi:MAG: DEAD/DEAH box helicase family protein [Candidatus Bathyarchaeia archaeon]|jgi:superfamily II DNA or RNA helicase